MTIHHGSVRRTRSAFSLAKSGLLAVALLAGVATQAFAAGSISGRVTGSDAPGGLANQLVAFYDLLSNDDPTYATTDGSGNYTANLPNGTYGVVTQNALGYINKIYPNISCSATCDTSALSPQVVMDNAITGVNFVLDPGGRITGRVTSSAGGAAIAGVTVYFLNVAPSTQLAFTKAVTDASGDYTSEGGTATGTVFAVTYNTQGFQNEVYNNIHCLNCDVEAVGTQIPVTLVSGASNIDFILDPGGRITGNVSGTGGVPLADVVIDIFDSMGNSVDETVTDAMGDYATGGLPTTGNYFAIARNAPGYVSELFDNMPCASGFCNPTAGTAIPVTFGMTTSGRNFVLAAGGTVTGTVTNSAGGAPIPDVFIQFSSVSTTAGATFGQAIFQGGARTNDLGGYSVVLPPGTAFASVIDQPGFANQAYRGLPCVSFPAICPATSGTPFVVTLGGTTGNIDFALVANPGSISGTVTNASAGGVAVNNAQVQVFTIAGTGVGNVNTNASGFYQFNGLPPGQYYVRTNANVGFGLVNQVWKSGGNLPCLNCNVVTSGGSLITVTAGAPIISIDFPLTTGGRISGTVTTDGTTGIQGISVQIYSVTGTLLTATGSAVTTGAYTSTALPAGDYYIRTAATVAQNFIDEAWDNVPCVPCTVTTGTVITVTGTANTTGKSFVLSPGGSIAGTVTDAGSGAPIISMGVIVFDSTGVLVKNTSTDASGNYTVAGLPAGNYYVRTNPNAVTQNYVAQLYSAFPVISLPTTGTPVDVAVGLAHGGINFALVPGGTMTGTVTGGGAPLPGVQIVAYSTAGRLVKISNTDAAGGFTMTGLEAGNYYVSTHVGFPTPFYQDELFDNQPCLGCLGQTGAGFPIVTLPCTSCAPGVTTGNQVTIANGATRTGVDFSLASGGGIITGIVFDAATNKALPNVQVSIYNGAGVLVKGVTTAANTGIYTVRGLAPGVYYARTIVSPATPHYRDEAFGNVPCVPCDVTMTSPITVTASGIASLTDFPLDAGGSITGSVSDAVTTRALASVDVQLYNNAGTLVKTTFTGSTGNFEFDGLPAGTYFARTALPAGSIYVDQLYNGVLCVTCTVTAGTGIVVTNGAAHGGVAFTLLSIPTVYRGDFNGDGKADILWRQNTGAAAIYLMDGATVIGGGGFTTVDPVWQMVGTGDYNGDGKSDILWRNTTTGGAAIWLMNGTAVIGGGGFTTVDLVWQIVGSGDYNGDGKADILWRNTTTGGAAIWLMNGTAVIGGGGFTTIDPVWQMVGSGDYNGDGKADILWRNTTTGGAAIWFMNGTAVLGGGGFTTVDLSWKIVGTGDYNGDGKADILWRQNTGTAAIWFMNGTATTGGGGFATVDLSWQIVGGGDHNGDGKADILWRQQTSGSVSLWLMDGTSTIGGGGVGVVDSSWQVMHPQ